MVRAPGVVGGISVSTCTEFGGMGGGRVLSVVAVGIRINSNAVGVDRDRVLENVTSATTSAK
jgi:hypothetical protein